MRDEEKERLYDLAAVVKPNLSLALDLIEYIKENEMLHKTLRVAKRNKLYYKIRVVNLDFILRQVCTNEYIKEGVIY